MVINGFQIDETEVLDASYGKVFTVYDLIIYVIEHAEEFRLSFDLPPRAVDLSSAPAAMERKRR